MAHGLQAIVLKVYTEPAFRRRGLARRLMQEVLAWTRQAQIESLDAQDGTPLSAKWKKEVRRRCAEVDRGAVRLHGAEAVFKRAHGSL